MHQIPTPSLTPETVKLAEAAEQALGSVTPRSKSPGSTSMTPVHMFGDDLTEILRNSPGMDLSKLQIKQERVREGGEGRGGEGEGGGGGRGEGRETADQTG